jgi:hypothetical protein
MYFNTQQNFMAGLSTRFLKRVPPQLLSSGVFYAYWLAVDRAAAQARQCYSGTTIDVSNGNTSQETSHGQALFISANSYHKDGTIFKEAFAMASVFYPSISCCVSFHASWCVLPTIFVALLTNTLQ